MFGSFIGFCCYVETLFVLCDWKKVFLSWISKDTKNMRISTFALFDHFITDVDINPFMYLLKIKPVQHISETVISIRNIFLKTFRYSLINCLLHLVNMKETNYDIQVKNHIQHPMHKLIPHLAIHSRPSLSCF